MVDFLHLFSEQHFFINQIFRNAVNILLDFLYKIQAIYKLLKTTNSYANIYFSFCELNTLEYENIIQCKLLYMYMKQFESKKNDSFVWRKDMIIQISNYFVLIYLVDLVMKSFRHLEWHLQKNVEYIPSIPGIHLSPITPETHPFGQRPSTWLHCSPFLHCPHVFLHSMPYMLISHTK